LEKIWAVSTTTVYLSKKVINLNNVNTTMCHNSCCRGETRSAVQLSVSRHSLKLMDVAAARIIHSTLGCIIKTKKIESNTSNNFFKYDWIKGLNENKKIKK
jgi:hypothetical protein